MKNILYILLLLTFTKCNQMNPIEKALHIDDDTKSIIAIGEILWKKTELSDNYENLTEAKKTFIFIEMLEAEVNNGGFDQYFFNSSGDYAIETLESLKRIKAHKTAKIITEAFEIFPIQPIPKDNEKRRTILKNINQNISNKWNQLEDNFYSNDENIGKLLLDYVKNNIEDFK